MFLKVSLFIPKNINILIINNIYNKRGVVLYNNKNYIFIATNLIKVYSQSNMLLINSLYYTNYTNYNNLIVPLETYVYLWDLFFLKKIKFKGKSYKIWKNKNMLFLIFNHSHITWCIFFNLLFKKLHKQKFIFISKNCLLLTNTLNKIRQIRPINLFTRRGLRLSKQRILKKTGKRMA
jgi:hypothetical protein